jgi:calcineurin-like phosphoesterase family protein
MDFPDFFTSDLHLGHVNAAVNFRGFDSVEAHNETLIDNWNSVVGPTDTVAILGDVCMGTVAETIGLVSRLNGVLSLQPGNHDWPHPGHHGRMQALAKGKVEKVESMERLYAEAFARILPLTIDLPDLTICHLPPTGDHGDEDRYPEFRPADRGQRVLHGHVHDMWRTAEDDRWINVGVDVHGFTPVAFDDLRQEFGI